MPSLSSFARPERGVRLRPPPTRGVRADMAVALGVFGYVAMASSANWVSGALGRGTNA